MKFSSTSGMLKYAKESSHKNFMIETEEGLIYRLSKENPENDFYSAAQFSHGICDDCAEKLYGKDDWYQEMKNNKKS